MNALSAGLAGREKYIIAPLALAPKAAVDRRTSLNDTPPARLILRPAIDGGTIGKVTSGAVDIHGNKAG